MRLRSKAELAALAALAYGPFLLSDPGRVSADSKQDLYLDPGRLLARATDLWDPHLGAGTVPHQGLGYLVPMGPWFWLFEQAGAPDWVAQRLWLGTLSLIAVLGARWLFRLAGVGTAGALAGSLVYLLTPYQLAFTARMSVLLLPWALLPWLVGWTMRATRGGGWRAPAAIALLVLAAGGVNASSLLFVAVGPLVWLLLEIVTGRGAAAVAATAARVAGLCLAICAWWIVGLRLQGAYGLPVLQLTENVRTVAEASSPDDVLRGLGNWFFYGRDRTGYSLDQAADYASDPLVVALSYAVPATALLAGLLVRWAHRAYFAALAVVGTVVAVGAWPLADPSPYGSLWEAFTTDTSVGLAFRNSPRAAPVVVLGLAGLLAAAVGSVPAGTVRRLAGAGVAVLAVGALLPVWQDGFLTDGMHRPEELPGHWRAAVAAIDEGDHATRVLEIPGSSFAAYEWGTTVEPITPGLTDRPYLAREVLPAGTAGTANLLDALDRRLQQGTLEPAALAPVARLLAVGTVVFRGDLAQDGRFDTPPRDDVWRTLQPVPPGLEAPTTFDPEARPRRDGEAPAVALFDVEAPRPTVRLAPATGPVLLAGDGDGIVDAAAAGLLDGSTLVLPAAALDDAALEAALAADAHLLVTDSNRRRIQTWFYSLRDTRGPTERAGETALDPTGYDFRLDPFPAADDDDRTVVEHVGGRVSSNRGAGPERPEDRAAHGVDGDLATAWRVAGDDVVGAHLEVDFEDPVTVSELRLVQAAPAPGGRVLTSVDVRVGSSPPVSVALTEASLDTGGQVVPVPARSIGHVRVTVTGTSAGAPTPVGLAEVVVGDRRVTETVRPPVDLLRRAGSAAASHGLDLVLTRLRLDLPGTGRGDDEARLDRRIELPAPRTFALRGTVRTGASAAAPDLGACRDDLLQVDGTPLAVRLAPAGDLWSVEACEPLALGAGSHRLVAAPASATGLDVDRLVLSSSPQGRPAPIAPRGAGPGGAVAEQVDVDETSAEVVARVEGDGSPFWFVLAQSHSDGWEIAVEGGTAGPQQLVDGYANGWLVVPDGPGPLELRVRWRPQRLVWLGLSLSGLAAVACAALLWRSRAAARPSLGAAPRLEWRPPPGATPEARWWPIALTGMVGAVVAPPEVAALGVVAAVVLSRWPRTRPVLAAVAPVVLLLSRAGHRPSLAWLAVLVLLADVAPDLRPRLRERPTPR